MQRTVRDLNRLYRELSALHALDTDPEGFHWIDANDTENSVLSFLSRGRDPHEIAVVVCNFTPMPRHDYRIACRDPGAISSVSTATRTSIAAAVSAMPVERMPRRGRCTASMVAAAALAAVRDADPRFRFGDRMMETRVAR